MLPVQYALVVRKMFSKAEPSFAKIFLSCIEDFVYTESGQIVIIYQVIDGREDAVLCAVTVWPTSYVQGKGYLGIEDTQPFESSQMQVLIFLSKNWQ